MRATSTRGARVWKLAVTLLMLLGASAPAAGKVKICVSFVGPQLQNPQGYQRLLESELRHHPTHLLVKRGCATRLYVEYIRVDTGGYLTGRLLGGIPHRVRVQRVAGLPARIREVVAYLLKREPVYLVENLATSGLLTRSPQSLLKHGRSFYGVELYQLLIWSGASTSSLVGGAFRFRRAVDRWFLGARVEFAYRPAPIPAQLDGPVFQMVGAAQVEVGVSLLRDATLSPYVSGLAGAAWVRIHGPVPGEGGSVNDDLTLALFGISLRAGVEFLRHADVRLDVFAQLNLPFHRARDADSVAINAYTPSLQLGCGVAF